MFSCMRLKPGPEVAVMAFAPAQLAPMTAPSEAISSSIWMAMPLCWGSLLARCSAISVAGVIGYPAKNLHPAVMAASAQASFPCQKYVPSGIEFGIEVSFFGVCGCGGFEIKSVLGLCARSDSHTQRDVYLDLGIQSKPNRRRIESYYR